MSCRTCRQPPRDRARGQRLRDLRRAHGHTQEAFAELIAVSPRHMRRLEAGDRTLDNLRLLERVARALGMRLPGVLDALNGAAIEEEASNT
jgi:transcriptional regulator with XRE-family HTH domain